MALRWRRAANGVLLGAILFLTILPYFGWAWHRVLPEHDHVFFGVAHDAAQDIAPRAVSPVDQPDLCNPCQQTQMRGTLHLPGSIAAQILGLAVSPAAPLSIRMRAELSSHVILFPVLYHPPFLPPLDPPPLAV